MASYFIDPEARHRIWLRDLGIPRLAESEDWVEIYAELPYRVAEAVRQAGLKGRAYIPAGREAAEVPLELDLTASRRELLLQVLLAWSLTDGEGRPVPIADRRQKEEALGRLPDWLVQALLQAVDEYYAARVGSEASKSGPGPGSSGAHPDGV